jgi:uncharacterized protein (DUF885 family)
VTRSLRSLIAITCFVAFAGACTESTPTDPPAIVGSTSTIPPTTQQVATSPPPSSADEDPIRTVTDTITLSLLQHDPELVTDLGAAAVVGVAHQDQLNDASVARTAAMAQVARDGIDQLDGLTMETMAAPDRLSIAILREYLEDAIVLSTFPLHDYPVSFITGAPANFIEFMTDVHPITTEADVKDYVRRLGAFGKQIDQLIAGLEERADAGMVPPQRSLDIARFQIDAAIGHGDAATHELVTDLEARVTALKDIEPAAAKGYVARAEAAVRGMVMPAFERLDRAIRSLDGRSDAESGVWAMPDGDAYYEAILRHHTSLDISPGAVHDLGLAEVERVRSELTAALSELGYEAENDFGAAVRAAAGDAGSYPTTSEQERADVFAEAVELIAAADTALAPQFGLRPSADLVVARPREGREGGAGAYYRPPPIDASRPGTYYLSLGGESIPLLTFPTTTYHEGVPGHHVQLSIQRNLENLPLHQRVFTHTGFVEGWALYAERLAAEAGLYDNDARANLGRLQMELLRAGRMVADTGIHHHRWTRSEAIDYLTELGFDPSQSVAEVDRYIVWPGQGPSYLMGMITILGLRDAAHEALGRRFDVAKFHDAVLGAGSVPLDLLDDVVQQWVDRLG